MAIERKRPASVGKGQRRKVGDIVKIDLGDEFHTYARVLEEALFAFYDSRTREDPSIDEILSRPVLFIVSVMNHAVTRGRWKVVGNAQLNEAFEKSATAVHAGCTEPQLVQHLREGRDQPGEQRRVHRT